MFLAAHGVFLFEDSLRLHECQCTISAETADAGRMSLRETRRHSRLNPRIRHTAAPHHFERARISNPLVRRPFVDRQRRQQQHRGPFGRHEQSVAPTLVMDSVRVVVGSNIDADRQALDVNRRRAVELELKQADAKILAHLRHAGEQPRPRLGNHAVDNLASYF